MQWLQPLHGLLLEEGAHSVTACENTHMWVCCAWFDLHEHAVFLLVPDGPSTHWPFRSHDRHCKDKCATHLCQAHHPEGQDESSDRDPEAVLSGVCTSVCADHNKPLLLLLLSCCVHRHDAHWWVGVTRAMAAVSLWTVEKLFAQVVQQCCLQLLDW